MNAKWQSSHYLKATESPKDYHTRDQVTCGI